MELFGLNASPYVRKVLLVAAEKGLDLTLVPAGLLFDNADFTAISPFKKIPAFRDGDFSICDSTAIITYLDAKYTQHPVLPAGPEDRARAIWFEEFADTILTAAAGKIFFNRVVAKLVGRPGDMAVADAAEQADVPAALTYLDAQLAAREWLVGGALSLADIAVFSPLMNLEICSGVIRDGRFPNVVALIERMLARPAIAGVMAAEKQAMTAMMNRAA